MIGKEAKDYLTKNHSSKEKESDTLCLTKQDVDQFYLSVRTYYKSACDYILKTWPLDVQLLKEAEVVDVSLRETKPFDSVQYFVKRFPHILDSEIPDVFDKLEVEYANTKWNISGSNLMFLIL
ncbi:hypothetical protein HOLleu_10868 [Holothuria leucospilota]|uniref:Uncharacterized protein n=1 Tax=Holothuria leucospilota TaxID=206669 RepID=A0A9Q1CFF0_HOLLE|nr:hypothetical protein HOLleu_10868 [Holothuria leucospilota]